MKTIYAALVALLLGVISLAPAQAQVSGITFAKGGLANYPVPDFTMCDFNVPTTFTNIWYIDPVNGFAQNDYAAGTGGAPLVTAIGGASGQGTATHPWKSLVAVFTNGTTGYPRPLLSTAVGGTGASPINPGDQILLMTGAYGAINANTNANSSFVVIAPAPSQLPVLQSLIITANRLAFVGNISVQMLSPVQSQVDIKGSATNVVIDGMSVSTASYATSATWTTPSLWLANQGAGTSQGIGFNAVKCIQVINSHIFNTMNGATFGYSNHIWFQNNEIDNFTEDGIDYSGQFLFIDHNYLHDLVGVNAARHMDFMQGFCICTKMNNNVWLNGNIAIYRTDPATKDFGSTITSATWSAGQTTFTLPGVPTLSPGDIFNVSGVIPSGYNAQFTVVSAAGSNATVTQVSNPGAYVSGGVISFGAYNGIITQTDDAWSNLFITNNIGIAPPFPHGFGIGGCSDCIMANNSTTNLIEVNAANFGRRAQFNSSNLLVTNNISGAISCADPAPSVKMTNNIIMKSSASGNTVCFGGVQSAGFGAIGGTSVIGGNYLDTGGVASEFVNIDTVGLVYNCHLLSTAPAKGFGQSALPRPLVDELNRPLNSPVDSGALAYP